MANSESIYQSYVAYDEGKKSDLIELRDEQRAAVKAAKDYFEASKDNQRFLWNCKMRFGKTFCAMELAIEMGESEVAPKGKKDSKPISRVLILTHRPVVKDGFAKDLGKLQKSLKSQGKLKREWLFGTRSEYDDFGNFYDLEKGVKTQNKPYVFFSSTQWLCYSKEVGGTIDDPLRKSILNNDWDLVVIDEAHEGILADRGSVVIAKLTRERTKMLYMSGTPFNLLEGTKGFSEEQIYSWDYIEEQKKKNGWNKLGKTNPYQELPKMNIFAFNMGTLIPGKDYKKGDMFSFGEMFRTFVGRKEVDIVDGKPYEAKPEEIGKFVHEKDVRKFLDLMYLGDEKTNYPYTKEQYQENFRHTLWIVPGIKEAKALKELLEKHELFGSEAFKVVNVAGNNEVDEKLDDLGRVKEAIAKYQYTITLSCGKLTTGVTVPEWTAVFYMKGSADSSPATYMQTIFRVQSPHVYEDNGEKRMKANSYVFDFAPGRSLKVVAATAKFARKTKTAKNKTNIITQNDEEIIKDFTKYCPIWQPVVAKDGSSLQPISTEDIITELNKVYVENIVKNGFDDYNIYLDDEILKLSDEVIQETKDIVDNIPGDNTDPKKKDSTELSDDGGLTTTATKKRTPKQKQTEREKWQKEVDSGKTTEDFDTWLARKDKEAEDKEKLKKNRMLIHTITKRIPLLMFGAEVDDETIGINIDNITERIDDDSWNEFMPKGATKPYFRKIKHCYNDTMFRKAGTMIRDWARETDDMHIEERIARIAKIFNYFKNPDKETVLTPWRVVNMHMSQTIGGHCFYDETFRNLNKVKIPARDENGVVEIDENGNTKMVEKELPHLVGEDTQVYKDIFGNINKGSVESETKVLEINSKTGLYPLYVAYSLYKPLMALYMENHMVDNPDMLAVSEERAIWNTIIKNNIYVICNTDMAVRITYRTLAGYNPIDDVDTSTISESHYIKGMHIISDKLVKKAIEDKKTLIKLIKSQGYWENNDNDQEMKFNVIVGNPPYQMTDKGDAASDAAAPIYQHFVETAKALEPNYISIIMPSKWMVGGRVELDSFRKRMKEDTHIQLIMDFEDDRRIFPTAHNDGGICFFLWNKNKNSCKLDYKFHPISGDVVFGTTLTNKYTKYVIRNSNLLRILDKIGSDSEKMSSIVSKTQPFGIRKDVFNNPERYENAKLSDRPFDGSVKIYGVKGFKGGAKRTEGYITKDIINDKYSAIDKYKLFFTTSYSSNAKIAPEPIKGLPNEICTETFLLVGPFKNKVEMENCYKYMHTTFFRFLLYYGHGTMQVNSDVFAYIPKLDFSKTWDDEKLYNEFGIKDEKDKDLIKGVLKE